MEDGHIDLSLHGRQGRMKVRHFNDLKDATIRGTEIESSNEEVLADSKTEYFNLMARG